MRNKNITHYCRQHKENHNQPLVHMSRVLVRLKISNFIYLIYVFAFSPCCSVQELPFQNKIISFHNKLTG